jgi:hypothetical protein
MKIVDLISEGKWAADFQRYRQMGQKPTQLATHVAKKAIGATTGQADSPKAQPKNNLGDTTEIKSIIDQVISGQQLDSQSLQALKQFKRKL